MAGRCAGLQKIPLVLRASEQNPGFPHLRPARLRTRARGNCRHGRVRGQKDLLVVDLSQYLPILIFLGIAIALSGLIVLLPMGVARMTGSYKPNADKLSEYECGFPAFEDPRSQFDVRFYLVAILFIIFDLEAAFLFPWAVSLDVTGWPGWITMMVFLFELAIGLAYAWKKGALDWE
jgi:NADH-quinone oxidoreductase subunit A